MRSHEQAGMKMRDHSYEANFKPSTVVKDEQHYPDELIQGHYKRKQSGYHNSDVRHGGAALRDNDVRSESKRRRHFRGSAFCERSYEVRQETPPSNGREGRTFDYCFSRDRYDRSRQVPGGREEYYVNKLPPLRINGKGEPKGDCEKMVTLKLTPVVRKYVPIKSTWSAVSVEVKYKICQELQGMFKDGARIDGGWIKSKARKIHASARDRAKSDRGVENAYRYASRR